MFSFKSNVISWSSKKQPTIALSNTKVEYIGIVIVACEVVWLQKLLSDLDNQWMFLLSFIVITSKHTTC
jgi:hypothetical protein